MNVFYVGPYRQRDSWGDISRSYIKFLSKHTDLAIRPVYYSSSNESCNIDEELQQLESKKIEDKDIIIQHGLPYNLIYDGSFNKNIAITSVSCCIGNTSWVANLNLFDKIIVFSEVEEKMLIESGVTTEIYAYGFPPIDEEDVEITNLPIVSNGKTIFYTIGSLEKSSSGIKETLLSYLSEFSVNDNVLLIIFTDQKDLGKSVKNIKSQLGKFQKESHYADVAIVDSTQESIIGYAHKFFQCFINVSYAGIPNFNVLRAGKFKKIIITLDTSKLYSEDYKFYVDTQEEVVIDSQKPIKESLSGEFTWKVPNTSSLKNKLRLVYNINREDLLENKNLVREVSFNMITLIDKWTKESLCMQ